MAWGLDKYNGNDVFNYRCTAGVWLVTRPAGEGGGAKGPRWDLPKYWTDFQVSNVIR